MRRMRKILTVLVAAGLVWFGSSVPVRQADADIIDFTSLTGDPVGTGVLQSLSPWEYQGVSVWAASSLGTPRVTFNQGYGLGVLGGTNTNPAVNNGQVRIPFVGYVDYVEGLLFRVPEGSYFTSVTLSGLTDRETAYVRVVQDWDLGDILNTLTGDSLTGFEAVSSSSPRVDLSGLFGESDWQWLLVRTPCFTEVSSTSFYVAQVEVQAVPEPSVLILLGCGFIGLGVFRRFSKKS